MGIEAVHAVGVIVPVLEAPFEPLKSAVQFTAVLVLPDTVALNWNCSPVPTVTAEGVRLTRTPESMVTSVIANTEVFP